MSVENFYLYLAFAIGISGILAICIGLWACSSLNDISVKYQSGLTRREIKKLIGKELVKNACKVALAKAERELK